MITVTITLADLIEHGACFGGINRFRMLYPSGVASIEWSVENQVKLITEVGQNHGFTRWLVSKRLLPTYSLSHATLPDVSWSYTDLHRANLYNANLRHANLSHTNLRYADLRNTDLSNADMCNVDLRYADLSGADLSHVNLTYAYLSHVNLTQANLRNANLRSANLSGADCRGADFTGANFHYTNLTNIITDENTKGLPS